MAVLNRGTRTPEGREAHLNHVGTCRRRRLASWTCRLRPVRNERRDLIGTCARRCLITVMSVRSRHASRSEMTDNSMPEPSQAVIGGIDCHTDFHVAAALDPLGRVLGTDSPWDTCAPNWGWTRPPSGAADRFIAVSVRPATEGIEVLVAAGPAFGASMADDWHVQKFCWPSCNQRRSTAGFAQSSPPSTTTQRRCTGGALLWSRGAKPVRLPSASRFEDL